MYVVYCSSVIIDENQILSAHKILNRTTFESSNKKESPQNNRPKQLLLKAGSYLNIENSNVTSCTW